MSLYPAEDSGAYVDRRGSARFRIRMPAQLRMPSGTKHGTLSDISEGGAKLVMDNPPAQGASVLLVWGSHEEFCKVMWIAEDSCGLQFERPISRAVVVETTGQEYEAPSGPVAQLHNIPLGRKRARPGFGG